MKEIFTRHSVRRYEDRPVEKEKIELLLKAAMAAPTAGDQKEWEFVVVTDPEIKKAVAKASPYAGCAANAGVVIVVAANMQKPMFPELWQQDLGTAMENILLEAVHLDLGGVWLSVAPYEDRMTNVAKALGMPDHVYPYAIASIGYPLKPMSVDGRNYDMSLVHYDRY